MVKFREQTNCNFFPTQECEYPISEDVFKAAIEEAEEGETLSQVPEVDSPLCTNCLLSQLLVHRKK